MIFQKKYCLATVSDSRFLSGTLVLLHSFLEHNSWFKGDIVVFTNDLSAGERQYFDHFPRFRFEEVDPVLHERTEKLSEVYDRFQHRKGQFYSLNAFKLYDYDRVLFLDSDFLIRGSFKSLFRQKGNLLVCGDAYYYKGKRRDPKTFHKVSPKEAEKLDEVWTDTFNSGMMMIDRSVLTPENYQAMVDMINVEHFKHITSSHSDQMLINQQFRDNYSIVSSTWNYRFVVSEHILQQDGVDYDGCKAVHYTARKKPWEASHALRSFDEYPEYPQSFDEWQRSWRDMLHARLVISQQK
ncbi:MAG: hypothetical protein GYB31_02110 [Bacteroidetes bacterium]|nr:hypothetical protein [Bacteroidota bacterium]